MGDVPYLNNVNIVLFFFFLFMPEFKVKCLIRLKFQVQLEFMWAEV